MSKKIIIPNDSIAYVNSNLFNDTEFPIRAEYAVTFSSSLIEKAGEYYMAISRFNVPNTQPIFEFNSKYYVTIRANGQDYTTELLLESADQNPTSNKIYSYQQFIDMINNAFRTSYLFFKTNNPGSTTTNPPKMIFNRESGLCSILFDQEYVTEIIRIYFNTKLNDLFLNSFNIRKYGRNLPNKKDVEIIIQDEGFLRGTQIELKQQSSTLADWYDFRSIIFTSNSLPIKSELITTKNSNGNTINQSIISDFIPEFGKERSSFIYNANPYRLVDMSGQSSIDKIDFRVEYITKSGEIKPLFIEPGYSMSVKFIFLRKDPTQNYYL